jgi:transcriptional regulator with XRE-family HTH domain
MATGNFGERLRREREMREVSIEEIAKTTRIPRRYLEALEREEWSKLPGGIFARGFVRTIARFLGLDEQSLLGEFDLARSEDPAAASHPPPRHISRGFPRWLPLAIFVLLLLCIAAGAVYGWRRYAAHRNSRATPAQPSPSAPVRAPGLSAAAGENKRTAVHPEGAPLDLSVSTSASTRVRVVADGALLLDGEMPAGQNRRFTAKDRFEVTAADSSAVLLELNNQVMPPIGAPGASGTITLSRKDLKQAFGGTSQP